MNELTLNLIPALMIFSAGLAGVLCKRNLLVIFMCIELMLCGTVLVFAAFSSYYGDLNGIVFSLFIMAIAAAEVALALAVIVQFFKLRRSISANDADRLGD